MSSRKGGQQFAKSGGGGGRQQPHSQPRGNQGFGGSQGGGGSRGGPGQGGGQRAGPGGGGGYRGGPPGGGRGGYGRAPEVPPRPTRNFQIVQMAPNENQSKFKGKLGQPTNVVANYFRMGYKNGMQLHQYRVDYYVLREETDRKEISTKRRLAHRERFWKFVAQYENWFKGKHNLAYDDSHLLYTVEELDFGTGDLKELVITEMNQQGEEVNIQMVIKPAALFQIRFDDDGFKVLNLILTQYARCPIDQLDRTIHCDISRMFIKPPNNYHPPLDLGGFQMLRGLYAFAKRGLPMHGKAKIGQAFANFDVIHSAFYKVGIDILQFYAFAKRGQFLNEAEIARLGEYGMNQNQRNELRSLLSGLKVKKKKVAEGIVESEASFCNVIAQNARSYRFNSQEYGNISVEEYYLKRYGYRIRFPTMPLIQLMPREKNLMVPIEVLKASDRLQRLSRKLPDVLQAMTNQFTTTHPRQRFSDIDQMVQEEIHVTEDPFLRAFNVEIDSKFLEISARILPQPNCAFARDQRQLMGIKAVEGPQHEGKPVQVLFDLIIVDRCVQWNEAVWNHMANSCRQRGINMLQILPLSVNNEDFNANTVDKKISALVDKYKKLPSNIMPICIVIIPNNRTDIYKAFKGIFELRFGVRSQVITQRAYNKLAGEVERGPMGCALVRNIFLKINAKCGGVNCRIQANPTDNWSNFVNPQSPTLFIGIDVTHPAPGDTLSPSISALVGNIDVHVTRFTATVRAQHHRTEWIENMHLMFHERLLHFKKGMEMFKNGAKLPSKIIVFRDGVSESQFAGLMEFEVPGIRKAIEKVYGETSAKPKLTVLVVQKRHNTRFFDRNDRDPKNNGNLKPGTVVDGFITSHSSEFYLCSHKGLMGTSKPSHYFVIYDENKFTADDLQVCANNLSYLFARAPMPVSIPAPVYYAHLACFRARHHWAAADDGLPVGQNGQPLARETIGGEEFIMEPNQAVVVQQNLKPAMYFC